MFCPQTLSPDVYGFEGICEGGVVGSCPTFRTRKDVTAEIHDGEGSCLCSFDDVMNK